MSLKEYKELERIRQEEAQKAAAHYKSVDLPGTRIHSNEDKKAKDRIEEMKKVKQLPNHD